MTDTLTPNIRLFIIKVNININLFWLYTQRPVRVDLRDPVHSGYPDWGRGCKSLERALNGSRMGILVLFHHVIHRPIRNCK